MFEGGEALKTSVGRLTGVTITLRFIISTNSVRAIIQTRASSGYVAASSERVCSRFVLICGIFRALNGNGLCICETSVPSEQILFVQLLPRM